MAIFDPDGCTLEEYNKLPLDIDLNDVDQLTVPLEIICPVIPSYFTGEIMQEVADVMQEIVSGKRPGPTTSIGVGLASILAANEAVNIILRRRDIAAAPKYTYIDLLDRKFIIGTIV
jgi:hypothetical protein